MLAFYLIVWYSIAGQTNSRKEASMNTVVQQFRLNLYLYATEDLTELADLYELQDAMEVV